jgi:Mn-dependent DtxR family transcriptional regulator
MNDDFYTVRGYEMKNYNKNTLTASMEDYLEMISRECAARPFIRVNELAQRLNVKDSSATKMVQKLGNLGYVDYQKYGMVTLTVKGRELGAFLLERHTLLEKFLSFIGCTEDALKQTELIEHNISPDTLKNIELLYGFLNENRDVLKKYHSYKKAKIHTKQARE